MTRTLLSVGLLAVGSGLFATSLAGKRPAGTDWPHFLGPTRDGKSTETGIRKVWKASGPPLLWSVPTGEGYAGPSVAGERLFLFDRHGDKARLTCLNARTGAELWRSEYVTDYEDMYQFSNGPRAAPVVDGNRVYTFGVEGRLRCLNVKDGSLIWEIDTSAVYGVVQNFFGVGSVPLIEGNLLIVAIGGSPPDSPGIMSGEVQGLDSGIVAFDKRNGKERYRVTSELASYSSPTVATIDGRRWGFLLARGGLIGFEPGKGKVDFFFPFRSKKLESVNASNPVVVGDTVYVTESYGVGSAILRVEPGKFVPVRRDASRRNQSMSCHFMTPVYHEGYLYGSSGEGSGEAVLRAVEYKTGRVAWSQPGLGRCTLLWVDGHLVVLTERGRLLLVEATPERYNVVADAPGTAELLENPTWSPPVLSHGVLYLRGKDLLVAYELIP